MQILIKVAITTVVFGAILLIALIASTLIVQGHTHPDYWVTTKYDIATGGVVALVYLVTIIKQITRKP